eukprot:1186622-Prorocentrum_minimum.AAC.1
MLSDKRLNPLHKKVKKSTATVASWPRQKTTSPCDSSNRCALASTSTSASVQSCKVAPRGPPMFRRREG